jgi:hypothetical protein
MHYFQLVHASSIIVPSSSMIQASWSHSSVRRPRCPHLRVPGRKLSVWCWWIWCSLSPWPRDGTQLSNVIFRWMKTLWLLEAENSGRASCQKDQKKRPVAGRCCWFWKCPGHQCHVCFVIFRAWLAIEELPGRQCQWRTWTLQFWYYEANSTPDRAGGDWRQEHWDRKMNQEDQEAK